MNKYQKVLIGVGTAVTILAPMIPDTVNINLNVPITIQAQMSKKEKAEGDDRKKDDKIEDETEKMRFKEAIEEIEALKVELNEVNLLNAKLLYANKIFKSKNLLNFSIKSLISLSLIYVIQGYSLILDEIVYWKSFYKDFLFFELSVAHICPLNPHNLVEYY